MTTKKKHKAHGPSNDDVIRLGAEIAGIKASTPKAKWAKFVKQTHAKGFTVAGGLSGNPDALKERLQSSLKTQAQSTIDAAYKPAQDSLKEQDTRITAWDEKRKADNTAYTNWLLNANAQLNHANDTAVAQLHAAATPATANWQQSAQDSKAAVAAQPGTVSDLSTSSALNYAAPAARDTALAASSGQSTNAVADAISSAQSLTKDNAVLYGQAMAAKEAGQTTAQRNDLLDQTSKLNIQKATDYLAAFTKLQDNELTKANANRDYSTATAALDLKTTTAANTLKLNQGKADETVRTNKEHEAIARGNEKIARGQLALGQGKADLDGDGKVTAKDYKLKKQIDHKYGSGSTAKVDGLLTGTAKVHQIGRLTTVKGRLTDLRARKKAGKMKGGIRQYLLDHGYSASEVNAAEYLTTGKPLTAAQARAIKSQLGVDPSSLG